MDWAGVIVAGLVATAVFTVFMYSAPMMGMPKMDIAQTIGSMVLPQGNAAFGMGMMMHFVNGIIFLIIYAAVWAAFGAAGQPLGWFIWTGLIFGLVHFVVAMMGLATMPMMHKEIKAGRMQGMVASGGMKGAVGALMGHVAFGLVAGVVYGAFV